MNHRAPRHPPRESLRAFHYVAMLLLPVLDPTITNAAGRSRSPSHFQPRVPEGSAPYLLAVGPPPLRFQEYEPPPDPSTRLPAGAPPNPGGASTTDQLSPDISLPASETTAAAPPLAASQRPRETPPKKPGPPAIIPDDTRPPVRPEDFLPFFQIPAAGRGPAEVSVVVPVPPGGAPPAPLPSSSATYTQTPR